MGYQDHSLLLTFDDLDDHLFQLWKDGLCEEREVVMKSNLPDDLTHRINMAKKGLLDDEDDDFDDEDDDF